MSEIVIRHTVELPTQKVLALAFSPDGQRLAAGDKDGFIHIIDSASGKVLRVLGRHVDFVYALAFDPDTGHLISSGKDKSLRVWNIDDGAFIADMAGIFRGAGARSISAQACRQNVRSHTMTVRSIACAPGGLMATGAQDCKVKFWKNGDPVRTYDWHTAPVTAVRFDPETRVLHSSSQDQTIRSWNETTGAVIHKYSGHGAAICGFDFIGAGRFVSADASGVVILWNTASESPERIIYSAPRRLMCMRFDAARKRLILGAEDGAVEIADLSDLGAAEHVAATAMRLHASEVRCIDTAGRCIATGDNNGKVILSEEV